MRVGEGAKVIKLHALQNAVTEILLPSSLLSQACLELLALVSPPHHLRSSFNHAESYAKVICGPGASRGGGLNYSESRQHAAATAATLLTHTL